MNMQTQAGFKKETLSFFRTGRFFIISAVLICLSALSPLLYPGLGNMMDAMSDIYDEVFDIDISRMSGMLSSASSLGVSMSVSDITGVGLMVFLLLINHAAGGEQKKRDVIIPRSAGLRSFGYLFPKFIVYPLSAFILSVLGMFTSWGVSSIMFEVNDVAFDQVLLAGVLAGLCMMLYVCLHITLGTATGKTGLSAAVCIGAAFLLPTIFSFADSDYLFNPFALNGLAGSVITQPELSRSEMSDIAVTIFFALALMVIFFFIALFAQNAKKVDNTGNEMEL